jgi:hypothetical protein
MAATSRSRDEPEGSGDNLSHLQIVSKARKPNAWWIGRRSAAAIALVSATSIVAAFGAAILGFEGAGFGRLSRAQVMIGGTALGTLGGVLWAGTWVRMKLFGLIHRPYRDLDYLFPFVSRRWSVRLTYLVTRIWFRDLAAVVRSLDRRPLSSLL